MSFLHIYIGSDSLVMYERFGTITRILEFWNRVTSHTEPLCQLLIHRFVLVVVAINIYP